VRFAVIAWPHQEAEVEAVCARLKAPNEVRELALLACRNRVALRAAPQATAAALLELFKRTDALRRPGALPRAPGSRTARQPEHGYSRARKAFLAAAAVDAGAIAAQAASPAEIARLVDEARVRAIERA
jgi:tRNA nucleotidyltransferase (CCA-adding enzyme)